MFANVVPCLASSARPVCAIAVDAEEDFDWHKPVAATAHSTDCMRHIPTLQEILAAYGAVPSYLLTYPVLQDDDVVQILHRYLRRGQADAGVQLHPWVNPPFEDANREGGHDWGTSFSGNLPPGLEERKLVALRQRFIERFGTEPTIYRAGRYGLGHDTPALLEKLGFTIDTSLAPRTNATDEGGPDHTHYDYQVFWFGQQRRLLEVPLCRSTVGWGGRWAPEVYRRLEAAPALRSWRIPGIISRLRFAERITLSPEGNDVGAMLRLVRHLRARGQAVFVLSFHSSSLAVGRNPYVQNLADLHGFYDRLSAVLDAMATRLGFTFARLAELPGYLRAGEP
jgi:hypothetical protein